MKKDLPTLLLEAERAFKTKFCRNIDSDGDVVEDFIKHEYVKDASAIKSFLRETVLSILSEAEKATEVGEESNVMSLQDGSAVDVSVGFNEALAEVKSLWREWRGNLK